MSRNEAFWRTRRLKILALFLFFSDDDAFSFFLEVFGFLFVFAFFAVKKSINYQRRIVSSSEIITDITDKFISFFPGFFADNFFDLTSFSVVMHFFEAFVTEIISVTICHKINKMVFSASCTDSLCRGLCFVGFGCVQGTIPQLKKSYYYVTVFCLTGKNNIKIIKFDLTGF